MSWFQWVETSRDSWKPSDDVIRRLECKRADTTQSQNQHVLTKLLQTLSVSYSWGVQQNITLKMPSISHQIHDECYMIWLSGFVKILR